jgi:hypothetical protein
MERWQPGAMSEVVQRAEIGRPADELPSIQVD